MAQQERKSTQRQRLLRGMVEVANRRGFSGANVSAVIAQAGISRPTFYEYFADRGDCFRASIEDIQTQLLETVSAALQGTTPDRVASACVEAIVAFTVEDPAAARFLMSESMTGDARALDVRDRGIEQIAACIETAQTAAKGSVELPDLDPVVLTGTLYRLIATRLRRGEMALSGILDDLLAWVGAYERPAAQCRWLKLHPMRAPGRSAHLPDVPLQQMPGVLPPGRTRLSEQEVGENHRLRILYAVARLAEQKGYNATTVADITKLARIDGRVFYRHFSDKQEAFAAVHELGFQQVMDITGKAFFSVDGWPQRSWEAGRALVELLQENPLVAHVGFVEAYAVGAGAIQRIEDSHTSFMYFLQEGLLHSAPGAAPSRVAMEAVIAGIFEIVYLKAREPEMPQVAAMLPYIAHLWLSPFLGVEKADGLIDAQLGAEAGARNS
jgi:AcrR family transcriptional regulator